MEFDTFEALVENILEVGSALGEGLGDEIDALLTWLNPNETMSNHQLKPPSLRLKNGIKLLFGSSNNLGVDYVLQLQYLVRTYYIYQVRINFFNSFADIVNFKDVIRLERYYDFPLKHVPLFYEDSAEWLEEINGFRHYLINRNPEFRHQLKARLRYLLKENDYDLAQELIIWIDNAKSSILSSQNVIMDLMLDKIAEFSDRHMRGIWDQRYMIIETYNKFITRYWSQYSQLLKCAEDDHDITSVVYDCFEKHFLAIRLQELFDISVFAYPKSKNTLLELRKVLANSKDTTNIIVKFLLEFEKRVMNPSVSTCDALLAYIKAVKSFLLLDPSGRYLHSITSFINPYLQERSDLVIVLLHAILDLQLEDLEKESQMELNPTALHLLSQELRDDELSIEGTFDDMKSNQESKYFNQSKSEQNTLECQEVIQQMLSWQPEPTNLNLKKTKQLSSTKTLLDILLEIFDDSNVLMNEFVKLLGSKLLSMDGYHLDLHWSRCLQLLKSKFRDNNPDGPALATNIASITNADLTHVNNIDVMLWDLRTSQELARKLYNIEELDKRVVPKIVSTHYWNYTLPAKSRAKPMPLNPYWSRQIQNYTTVYSSLKPGRTLQFLPDQGWLDLNLTFKDNRAVACKATWNQYNLLTLFTNGTDEIEYSLQQLQTLTKLETSTINDILKFWCNSKVLFKTKEDTYRALECL